MKTRVFCPLLAAATLLWAAGCGGIDLDLSKARGAKSLSALFRPMSPEDAVKLALDQYDADHRYRGTALLANAPYAGDEPYRKLFEDAARDEDAGVRQVGVRALGIHGTPEDVPLLVERLDDNEWLVRVEAARSLQRLHNEAAVVPLINHTDPDQEDQPAVRAEAALALGQYRQQRVVQALIAALNDPSLAVNHNALRSLETLTGQDLGFEPAEWLAWLDSTDDPFAAGRVYTYPGFHRGKLWYEYIPFMPQPPSEAESIPVGLSPRFDS